MFNLSMCWKDGNPREKAEFGLQCWTAGSASDAWEGSEVQFPLEKSLWDSDGGV